MFSDLAGRHVFVRNDSDKDILEQVDGKEWFIPAKCAKGPVDKSTYDPGSPETARRVPMPVECAQILVRRRGLRKVSILWDTVTLESKDGRWVYAASDKPFTVCYDGKEEVLRPYERRCFPSEAARHFVRSQSRDRKIVFFGPPPSDGEFLASKELGISGLAKLGRYFDLERRKSTTPYDEYANAINHAIWQSDGKVTKADLLAVIEENEAAESQAA